MNPLPDLDAFRPLLDQDFTLRLGEREVPARLIEAHPFGKPARGRRPFSLLFRIAHEIVPPQRIYRLHHPDLGDLDLFLVPIGPDSEGMQLQAIFT